MSRFKRCPLCGVSVKVENVRRHAARAHPGRKVDFGLSEEELAAVKGLERRRPALRRTERVLYPVLAGLVVVALLIFAAVSIPTHRSHETGAAPDFTLTSTDGALVRLSDYRGRPVLLDFMDTDCRFCQEETASVLVPLHAVYGDRVVFISVDVGFVGPPDTVAEVRAFKAIQGATWTYVMDDGTVARKYGVTGTPTTFVLDPNLEIRFTFQGMTDYNTLADALESVLGG
jgi:peroxiredoxin